MCEIPSPCFNAVFTGILLDHSSLPPDFLPSRFVKSLALALTRYLQAFCSITAHFRPDCACQQICEIPSPCFNAVFTGILLDHSSLTPDCACQQICEIPSPCFNAVFTSILLDHSSLPPDFGSRSVKSLALALTRIYKHFARSQLTSARFCQQICENP